LIAEQVGEQAGSGRACCWKLVLLLLLETSCSKLAWAANAYAEPAWRTEAHRTNALAHVCMPLKLWKIMLRKTFLLLSVLCILVETEEVCIDCAASTPGTLHWCDCCNNNCASAVHCNLIELMCDSVAVVNVHSGSDNRRMKVHISQSIQKLEPIELSAEQKAIVSRQQFLSQQRIQALQQPSQKEAPTTSSTSTKATFTTLRSTTISIASTDTRTEAPKKFMSQSKIVSRSERLRERLRELNERSYQIRVDEDLLKRMLEKLDGKA
jgi:hypothetical protein